MRSQANLRCCIFLACVTFDFISILVCPDLFSHNSPAFIRGTCMLISTRSSIGPESRDLYLSIAIGEQLHGFSRSHIYPHGQGFIAPIREKRAGYRQDWLTRLIVISPSSSGCLRVSRIDLLNSRNSSRKSTHLWASEISPGRASRPPPMIDASLAVWWMIRNGRCMIRGISRVRRPATEYILESSICSSSSISGSMPAIALASIVFPLPGGHCIIRLCPPAAVIRSARLACSCPIISEKSGE